MRNTLRNLFFIANIDTYSIAIALLFFLSSSLFDMLGLVLIGPFIAAAVGDIEKIPDIILELSSLVSDDILIGVFSIILTVSVCKLITQTASSFFIINLSQQLQHQLRNALLLKYSELKLVDQKESISSELLYSIQNLSPRFSKIILAVLKTSSDLLVALCIFSYLIINFPNLIILLVMVFILFFLVYERILGPVLKKNGRNLNISGSKLVELSQQIVDGFEEIKTYDKFLFFNDNIKEQSQKIQKFQTIQGILQVWPRIFVEFVVVSFTIGVILYYSINDNSSEILITLSIFGFAALRLIPAMSQLTVTLSELRFESGTLEKLCASLDTLTPDNFHNNKMTTVDLKINTLKMCNVDISVGRRILFSNFSYSFERGKIYGLTAPSGYGKTTLINSLLGLNEILTGKVLMNGEQISPSEIRLYLTSSRIPQNPTMFNLSIEDNIMLEDEVCEDRLKRLREVLSNTGLEQLATELNGRTIGERGSTLSGGQKQRVAVARSLYHKRQLMIMDEATNALDNKSEDEILKLLNEIKHDHIVILISHSQRVLNECDEILDLTRIAA